MRLQYLSTLYSISSLFTKTNPSGLNTHSLLREVVTTAVSKFAPVPHRNGANARHRRVLRWRRRNWRQSRFLSFFGVTIRMTKNNIFLVAFETRGRIIMWLTRNRENYNFQLYTQVGVNLAYFMLERFILLLKEVPPGEAIHCLTIKGRLPPKRIVLAFNKAGFTIRMLRVIGLLPHNGCRLPKRRRGAIN